MGIILIGAEHTKRTDYFLRAAQECGAKVCLLTYTDLSVFPGQSKAQLEQAVVKIDPPSYQTVELYDMKKQLDMYRERLNWLSTAAGVFLNTPQAIQLVLDKRRTKHLLQDKGVISTELIVDSLQNAAELLAVMQEKRIYNVFIKPCDFSGAAGVSAFRIHPRTGQMKLYTTCQVSDKGLYNTKKIWCYEDHKTVMQMIDMLSGLDCIVERWHVKDSIGGKSYDLRVVFQFDRIVHIVVRQSDGPMTNLHLNNQAAALELLHLDDKKLVEIETLCRQAYHAVPGLHVAGMDVMLDKGSRTPRIIEINGQGDLIYQDIFGENQIYRQQIAYLMQKTD